MARLRSDGLTLGEIGERYGITRQRVEQIIGTANKPATGMEIALSKSAEIISAYYDDRSTRAEIMERFNLTANQYALFEFPKLPKRITHGTITGYTRKCRCEKCREANRLRSKNRNHKLRAQGLCIRCGKESQSKWLCGPCQKKQYESYGYKPLGAVKKRIGKSGIRGITWNTKDQRWRVVISENGKQKVYGSFRELEKAKECNDRLNAQKESA